MLASFFLSKGILSFDQYQRFVTLVAGFNFFVCLDFEQTIRFLDICILHKIIKPGQNQPLGG